MLTGYRRKQLVPCICSGDIFNVNIRPYLVLWGQFIRNICWLMQRGRVPYQHDPWSTPCRQDIRNNSCAHRDMGIRTTPCSMRTPFFRRDMISGHDLDHHWQEIGNSSCGHIKTYHQQDLAPHNTLRHNTFSTILFQTATTSVMLFNKSRISELPYVSILRFRSYLVVVQYVQVIRTI